MERTRGRFQGNNSSTFSSRDRNNDSRKQWQPNFNSNQSNISPWNQHNPQQNISPWTENQSNPSNRYRNDVWQNNYNDINNWNQGWDNRNSNQTSRPQNTYNDNDGGYWRRESGRQNERDSGPWPSNNNNYNRDRRTPYDRPQGSSRDRPNRGSRDRGDRDFNTREASPEIEAEPLSPLEAKIEKLISAVQSQPDNIGQLILLQSNNEIPPVLLHNAAHQVKNCVLTIDRNESNGYSKLRVNNTIIAEGMYASKKDAKEALYEMGLEILKSKCFYITSKSHYEEVSMDDISNQKNIEPIGNTIDSSSKALQMMLKMGWGGKGLGSQEQGEQRSVADKIVENISREGLASGGKTAMQEVDKILADYARSSKTITLGFDSGFTKEERAHIHAIAAKYNLKSKSEGGFNNRRITISKKFSKWILIKDLLSTGLENESYILTIPDEFLHLWEENKEETSTS